MTTHRDEFEEAIEVVKQSPDMVFDIKIAMERDVSALDIVLFRKLVQSFYESQRVC